MSRKLKAVSFLAATLILLSGCGEKESKPISSDLAYDYAYILRDYVKKTGDSQLIFDLFFYDMDHEYMLEEMNRDLILEFMEDYLTEAYSNGWNDCEAEWEERREYYYSDGQYDGILDGYAAGYADGSAGLPYNEDMVRPPNNGYTGYIPQE